VSSPLTLVRTSRDVHASTIERGDITALGIVVGLTHLRTHSIVHTTGEDFPMRPDETVPVYGHLHPDLHREAIGGTG
jgi:hypothetical protein